MKFTKIKELNEEFLDDKNLREADEPQKIEPIETDAPVEEIADNYQDQAAAAGINVSDKAAEEVAEVGKEVGEKINSDEMPISAEEEDVSLDISNRLTRTLDVALAAALRLQKKNSSERANVLVSGLPGSSKTASIYNWAEHVRVPVKDGNTEEEADRVHITYLNAKNNDLDAYINGYTTVHPDKKLAVTQAVSDNLDSLDLPNSILFIDELNRQTKAQIRGSLLTLINEHYVVGTGKDKKRPFKNFLFTIAAINPGGTEEDDGAAKLNDAEKTRYLFKVKNFDSDPKTTEEYLNKYYTKQFNKEINQKNPDWDEIEKTLRTKDLGLFIVSHPDFKYDGKDKLNQLYVNDLTMLNQRSLTAGLEVLGYDLDLFKAWVKGEIGGGGGDDDNDFLPKTIEMLLKIIDEYAVHMPTFKELLEQENSPKFPPEEKEPEPKEEPEIEDDEDDFDDDFEDDFDDDFDDGIEDDEDLFNTKNSAGNSTVKTPDEAKETIKNITDVWKF